MRTQLCFVLFVIVFLLSGCATTAVVGAAAKTAKTAVSGTHKVLHTVRKAIV